MKIRRRLLFWALGDKTIIKAVSLLLVLKKNLGKTSSLNNASYNELARLAGASPNTIKRYMPIWLRARLVKWTGKRHDVFVVLGLSSKTKHRNIDLSRLDFKTFKSAYMTLRSFLFLLIISCKEFVKRIIRITKESKDYNQVKEALKNCNRYAQRNELQELIYRELGISYLKIAEKLGFCKRTAQTIVAFAVKKGWCHKHTHFEWVHMPGVNYMYVEGFTFTTANYGFIVLANTYTLNRNIGLVLIGGKI